MHQLKKYCEALADNLGCPVNIIYMDFPDVWCALEYLGSLVSSLSSPSDLKDIQASLSRMDSLIQHIQPMMTNLQDLNARFGLLEQNNKCVDDIVAQHKTRFRVIQLLLLQLPQHFTDFAALVTRVETLSSSLPTPPTPGLDSAPDPWIQVGQVPNSAPMPDVGLPSTQFSSRHDAPDVVVRLNTLEHAVKSLEKCTVGEGTKIGRFLFQSKEDLRLWMVMHVPNYRFGLFLDAVSIFDFLAQPHLDTQENMSQLYNSQKNGFETTYESRIVSSMQNLFPNLFGKSSAGGMDTAKALPGLQTVEKWNHNGVTGLYLQVERELPNVDLQFQHAIASTFDDYPEARDLS